MPNFYIDSADREVLAPLLSSGLFRGVTTNPTILSRSDVSLAKLPDFYGWAVDAGAEEVYVQAWGESRDEILDVAEGLLDIGPKVVVKVTADAGGFAAAVRLAKEGRPVLVTTVFNSAQALLAAAGGIPQIAPYLGRMADNGRPAMAEITKMHRALTATNSKTRLVVASLRSPQDIVDLAEVGIDSFAMSPKVARAFYHEPLTDQAVKNFNELNKITV